MILNIIQMYWILLDSMKNLYTLMSQLPTEPNGGCIMQDSVVRNVFLEMLENSI